MAVALIVNRNKDSAPIESFFKDIGYDLIYDYKEDKHDIVVFHGPSNNIINPFLCGQRSHLPGLCYVDNKLDRYEISVLKATPIWMPKIGFGRGAHLLNAMVCNGLTLYDVDNHEEDHEAYCMATKRVINVSSNHTVNLKLSDTSKPLLVSNRSTKFTWHDRLMITDHKTGWKDIEAFYDDTHGVLGFVPGLSKYREESELLVQYLDLWNKGELK